MATWCFFLFSVCLRHRQMLGKGLNPPRSTVRHRTMFRKCRMQIYPFPSGFGSRAFEGRVFLVFGDWRHESWSLTLDWNTFFSPFNKHILYQGDCWCQTNGKSHPEHSSSKTECLKKCGEQDCKRKACSHRFSRFVSVFPNGGINECECS